MEEREYVIRSFQKNFINTESEIKSAVIYGLGKNTQTILETFPDYPIIGILDRYQTSGKMFGRKILSLEELEGITFRIIIVARASAQKIIYSRIAEYCDSYHIEVFNLEGENLAEKSRTVLSEHPYFKVSSDELIKEIDQHDNISFDIFDTLITRKVLYPEIVFEMVSEKIGKLSFDFEAERIRAEKRLSVYTVPNIYEIYEEIKRNTAADKDTLNRLFELEIETEKEVIIRREVMVELFRYAVLQNKKVYLVSDMYLPKTIIKEILSDLNIYGYTDIFVSCEFRTNKSNELYDRYKEVVGEGSCLHIGDAEEADGIYARSHEIDSFLIKSPSDMLNISVCHILTKHLHNRTSILEAGMFACKVFNNPFCMYQLAGRIKIGSSYDFGYLYVAPAITEFILWLIDRLKEKCFNRILFISRDGYLVKVLYDIARKCLPDNIRRSLPESEYFLTSRTLCIASTIDNEEDIRYAGGFSFDGTPEEMLGKRFFATAEKEPYDEAIHQNRIGYALAHKEVIYQKSKGLKGNYLDYIKRLEIDSSENIAIFDFVSTGTCQLCIEKILGMKLVGMYYTRVADDYKPKMSLDIKSYTCDCNNYFLLENLIKEPTASLSYIGETGTAVYCKEVRDKEQLADIKSVQQAVKDYLEEYMNMSCDRGTTDQGIGGLILNLADKKYMDAELSNLLGYMIKDEFCNRSVELSI